jgi:type IV pilus assembly protein PilW
MERLGRQTVIFGRGSGEQHREHHPGDDPVRRAGGFSLVELMVAILLALIVTAGAIAVFVGSRNAYQSTSGVAAVTDGGRIAVDLIQQDVRNAGYIACTETIYPWLTMTPADSRITIDELNGAAGSLAYDFRYGISGYEATGTAPNSTVVIPAAPVIDGTNADWTPALDATFTDGSIAPAPTQTFGSDVLVVRESLPVAPAYLAVGVPAPGGATTLTVSAVAGLAAGQIAAVSDCGHAVVFQIGGAPAGGAGLVSVALANGAGVPGNVAGGNIVRPFDPGSLVMPVTTNVYYIGKGSDGDYALKRIALNAPNAASPGQFTDEEVVPDVENMQVLYGVATPTSFSPPEQYVTADKVPDFRQVVSVEIALLAASPPGSGMGQAVAQSYNLLGTTVKLAADNRQRRVFQFTVAVRNQIQTP